MDLDMCISYLQWCSVGFEVPREPRGQKLSRRGIWRSADFRFGGLWLASSGTGHPVPELGPEYRYPTWGTGTPKGSKPVLASAGFFSEGGLIVFSPEDILA